LCRGRVVCDFYLLVAFRHSHAHTDPVAIGVRSQLFLHRLCTGRGDSFSRLDNPLAWFQLSAAYAGVVWLLFIYDMRLIHARIVEARVESEHGLYARARSDQLFNIRLLVPALVVLNLFSIFAIWRWPDLFIARPRHIWLISAQLVSFIGYLIYTGR